MQRLTDTCLVPNRTLRDLIDRWLLSDQSQVTVSTGSGTAASLASLKLSLQSQHLAIEAKLEILKKVRVLCVESDIGRACLVQLGFFSLLIGLLFQSPDFVLLEPEFVEVGLDCVLSLAPSTQLDSLNLLRKEARLASFLVLLAQGNVKIQTSLCYLMETISKSNATKELCQILVQSTQVMKIVASLLRNTSSSDAAVRALSGICSSESNRINAIKEGAVDGLISYLAISSNNSSSVALATLELLSGVDSGKRALIRNKAAVGVLVKFVFRVPSTKEDDEGSEHAIGVLTAVCCESARARAEAVAAGVLSQVLLLMQSQRGAKAKAKARALLRLLRFMWGKDSSRGGGEFCLLV
ncbi:U-box domain-containing protein 26-like [Asparagus officinalis]|nr:U-box domain-containing protein 26-like [Asparagus officinalis]